ncbi:MAG: hypothetical protein AB1467_04220 [Candidatus Diapherotrites archaeon]
MAKKWLIAIILIIVIALAYLNKDKVLAFTMSFDEGIKKLNELDAKYNVGEGFLAPSTGEALSSYKTELSNLRKNFEPNQSNDSKALVKVIDIKIALSEMQGSLLKAQEQTVKAGIPDCSANGNVNKITKEFEGAISAAEKAYSLNKELKEGYTSYAKKIENFTENIEITTTATADTARELNAKLKAYCA